MFAIIFLCLYCSDYLCMTWIMCMCVLFLNNGQIKTNSSSSSSTTTSAPMKTTTTTTSAPMKTTTPSAPMKTTITSATIAPARTTTKPKMCNYFVSNDFCLTMIANRPCTHQDKGDLSVCETGAVVSNCSVCTN